MFSRRDDETPSNPHKGHKIIINGQEIDLNQYTQSGQLPSKIVIDGKEFDLSQLARSGTVSPQVQVTTGRRRRSGCGCFGVLITLIIIVSTVGGIGVAVLAVFSPNTLTGLMSGLTGISAPQTQKTPGEANSFDPFGSYAQVKAFAGQDTQLIEISANYVRSDGTLDLTATYSPAPSVDYQFAHEVPRPSNAPPVGAGGANNGAWYERITIRTFQPGQRRHVSIIKSGVRVSFDYVNEGMTRDVNDPTSSLSAEFVPAPKCTTAELWKAALAKDASKDAVAIIRYDKSGYSFTISGTRINLQFDMACALKTR